MVRTGRADASDAWESKDNIDLHDHLRYNRAVFTKMKLAGGDVFGRGKPEVCFVEWPFLYPDWAAWWWRL